MTTTRYFEVKVTGCIDCPMHYSDNFGDLCTHKSTLIGASKALCVKNFNQLTDSCPMWNETKESETK